jgi:site-specific recombinase XerD
VVVPIRAQGPLEPFREGFRQKLETENWSPSATESKLCLFSDLSRWLRGRGLSAADLTGDVVEEYFVSHRAQYSWCRTARSLLPLLVYLRSVGAAPPEEHDEVVRSSADELLESYRCYLLDEQGLTTRSVEHYLRWSRVFLRSWWPDGWCGADVSHLRDLDAASVLSCVRDQVSLLKVGSARLYVTATRSFLRFVCVRGLTDGPFAGAVPTVASHPGAGIPRAVGVGVVEALLASCDTTTAAGRRDAAVLIVLARLGLRAGEVAVLSLDDIDWRAGELVVAGKGRSLERLPLPADVGERIVAYLCDGRPPGSGRHLFVTASAPRRALSTANVSEVVIRACDRAGIARIRAHRLRHTVGTETLRAGASLSEVGQLLRHRSLQSTWIYAKVDYRALIPLALPWPDGAA